MNTIVVTAFGAPGSFIRRVQEDPTLAVGLFIALEELLAALEDSASVESHEEEVQSVIRYGEAETYAREALAKAKG